ncbi:hypothetical protein [Bartonella tribocorum]|uniref:hypothetical protein n=1 Tax=Bartonella tribocorum TaxID=85701 RepID=UPI0013052D21|nr:hypothetical protein [Bartonella tribocorum]
MIGCHGFCRIGGTAKIVADIVVDRRDWCGYRGYGGEGRGSVFKLVYCAFKS